MPSLPIALGHGRAPITSAGDLICIYSFHNLKSATFLLPRYFADHIAEMAGCVTHRLPSQHSLQRSGALHHPQTLCLTTYCIPDQLILTILLQPRPIESRFTLRENRVPHYQRLFQKHDGVRQWNKVSATDWVTGLSKYWDAGCIAAL